MDINRLGVIELCHTDCEYQVSIVTLSYYFSIQSNINSSGLPSTRLICLFCHTYIQNKD